MMYRFHIRRPYHTPILSIETDCAQIYRTCLLLEGQYLSQGIPKDSLTATVYVDSQGYRLIWEGKTYITEHPVELLQDLYRDCLTIDGSVFPMHGGAVTCGGEAVVFAGASGKGKTTLTAYLTQCGFPYITDDCVFIRKDDLQVLPYCKPLHLRPGGYAALEAQGFRLPEMEYADTADPRHCYMPPALQESPAPLRAIYFTEYTHENRLEELKSSSALELLLRSPAYRQPTSAPYLAFLISLLRKVKCHILRYRDLSYVKQILEQRG